ncbi:unnamed protein product [Phytophthora lilii]|uniref:Unnamed protein product n=1 Tax=Phytophthora lilii TaxID=2077276 RepID=A0A9W6THD9_9STRA|nr:unnamed protein product [Phytophthora lilii]
MMQVLALVKGETSIISYIFRGSDCTSTNAIATRHCNLLINWIQRYTPQLQPQQLQNLKWSYQLHFSYESAATSSIDPDDAVDPARSRCSLGNCVTDDELSAVTQPRAKMTATARSLFIVDRCVGTGGNLENDRTDVLAIVNNQ